MSNHFSIGTRSVAPAVEQQPAVAHVGNEHRIPHGSIRPDTQADGVVLSALGVTVTHVLGALTCLVALVMHVRCLSVRCSSVDGTQDRGHGQVAAGRGQSRSEGHTSSAFNPALGPWE